jgi:hypothetical protein
MFISILIIIVISSYAALQVLETLAYAARVAGRISHKTALGTTISHSVITLSRFSILFLLPSLAYLVESGISINKYLNVALSAYFFTFLASLIMLINLNKLQHFFQTVFIIYNKNTLPIAILKSLFNKNKEISLKDCEKFSFDKVVCKKTAVSFLAYIFLITGYFNAFLLAVLFPENRLTLSQFTSIFWVIGTITLAFYIDPMLSRSIDTYSDNVSWLKNVYSILIGRMMSYFVMITFLLILLVI